MSEPAAAEVIQSRSRALSEAHLSCRQIAKRLNASHTPTPAGKNQVWPPATVRSILTTRVYAGQARYHYRQPVVPRDRQRETAQRHELHTGRSYRPETDWGWSAAPAMLSRELFAKAPVHWQRTAELARKTYQPASRRS